MLRAKVIFKKNKSNLYVTSGDYKIDFDVQKDSYLSKVIKYGNQTNIQYKNLAF